MSVLFLSIFISNGVDAKEFREGYFAGRISKINEQGQFIRVKIDFSNIKFLNKKDKVEFWGENNDIARCEGYVVGKSNEYILVKTPDIEYCLRTIAMAAGAYINFFSQDLFNNLKMGKELVRVLLKKRTALNVKLGNEKKNLDSHIEKVNAVNLRYKILRDKLDLEWRNQINDLEEDRATTLRNFKQLEMRLFALDAKLERYKIDDENIKLDRWALDPKFYYRK